MNDLTANISLIYGDKGKVWLENLSNLQAELAAQWYLRDLAPCEDLSYNYVASGWQGELPIILKVGIDIPAIESEYDAICAFNGHGLVELLDADLNKGAILITRAIPGDTLITLFPDQDAKALDIACNLIA